jgi:hypothetical protein
MFKNGKIEAYVLNYLKKIKYWSLQSSTRPNKKEQTHYTNAIDLS